MSGVDKSDPASRLFMSHHESRRCVLLRQSMTLTTGGQEVRLQGRSIHQDDQLGSMASPDKDGLKSLPNRTKVRIKRPSRSWKKWPPRVKILPQELAELGEALDLD